MAALFCSTLSTTGLPACTKLPDAPGATFIVTFLLPLCAITGAKPDPVHVTDVLDGGALLLQAATA
ncbi:MAG TPA: hypothetical protein VGN31_13800 [Paraburkholderia sp.]